MNIKPRTIMIASLTIVLTAMSASTWAQSDNDRSDRQQRRQRSDRQMSRSAKIGQPAPNFRLKDSSGKTYSLSDYKGKLVVLQWISQDCPVCIRVNKSGITGNMLKTIKGLDSDFVHLTIHSNDGAEIAKSAEYLKKYDVKSPALDDTSGRVGRMYGAKTTPHMYVIDKKGILRYAGAIDDDDAGRKGKDAINYVINAVQQIVANETVTPDTTKSYGCAIKYAKVSERPGRGERGAGGRRGGQAGQMFGRFDTNGDGTIDAKELAAVSEDRFKGFLERMDTNKNGSIEKEEFEKAMSERSGRGEGRERRGRRGGRGGDGGAGGGGRGGDGG